MNKTAKLLKEEFESSSGSTPQFNDFFKTFKKEVTAVLMGLGCTKVEISKGHFYASGFFTSPSGQVYYLSLLDVRGNPTQLMYRTAQHYKDFSGGHNQWIDVDKLQNIRLQ